MVILLLSKQTHLTETLKAVRESKEPLTQIKNTLQEEINTCNKAINALSEEVTHLKQKVCACVCMQSFSISFPVILSFPCNTQPT